MDLVENTLGLMNTQLKLAEETMDLDKNTYGPMNTRLAEKKKKKNSGASRKHARTKEYSANTRSTLSKTPSLQNPHTLTHVSPSCDLTCYWSKLNA